MELQKIRASVKLNIYNIYWLIRHLPLWKNENSKMCLILGVARSGTTWAGRTIGMGALESTRYFEEPLFNYNPRLNLNFPPDHTAIPKKTLVRSRVLTSAYRVLNSNRYSEHVPEKHILRNDKNPTLIVVKEVHGLLNMDQLAKKLKLPIVFISRVPIQIVDSLLAAQTLDTRYFVNEYNWILKNKVFHPALCQEIESLENSRLKIISRKLITCIYIDQCAADLKSAYPNFEVFSYESLCSNPDSKFDEMATFLGTSLKNQAYNFRSKSGEENRKDPYSLERNTSDQIETRLRFIAIDEHQILTDFFKKRNLEIN